MTAACDTFYLKNRNIDGSHPRIVLCDPLDGKVVVVNLTEWAANKDQSCILEAGADVIVKKRSIVSYRDAAIVTVAQIEKWTQEGEIIPTDPINEMTLAEILVGCAITRLIKQEPYDLLDKLGLIPLV